MTLKILEEVSPFIRTDKRTVKRAAPLALYADYIERFYDSRSDEFSHPFTVDLGSEQSVQTCIRDVLSPSLPEAKEAPVDMDLFALGLDSLGVFACIKTLRSATGLGEKIATRHVYANPTIGGLARIVARIAADLKASSEASLSGKPVDEKAARLNDVIAQHKARQSFRLNSFDYVNPNHGMGLVFYFPIQKGVSNEQGLNRTFDMIPALGGKIMNASEQEIGYAKGDLCVTIPPLSMASSKSSPIAW
ncbi:unnamed protein product [Clonostachys rosea f. rosea IK726]|uniref:Uncharacterized protein n=1 Tax=Clonostachys rosea f. rosea IK726 TaxID=1349383 RepID=A0ACA9UBQ2_BIOOC|nr:unnamed protein product [Clonostachys rosea f. rosea IK726]